VASQLFVHTPEVWQLTDSKLHCTQSSDKLCRLLSEALCFLHHPYCQELFTVVTLFPVDAGPVATKANGNALARATQLIQLTLSVSV
jgi:hypothetical protein